MVKTSLISEAFNLKKRLVDNKQFLVDIEKSKTSKRREKLLIKANNIQLHVIRDLIKAIAAKDIEINKSILKKNKHIKQVVELIKKFHRTTSIYKSDASLRRFLIKYTHVLPLIVKAVLL